MHVTGRHLPPVERCASVLALLLGGVACLAQAPAPAGRPFATCDLLAGGEEGDTRVVFNITEGPKAKVGKVEFVGNTFVSGPVLQTHVNSSNGPLHLGVFGTPFSRAMIEEDVNKLIT